MDVTIPGDSLENLKQHMLISETLMNLHKHGNEIQNALLLYKGKKALRTEANKSIYKMVFDSCNYSSGSLMNDLMTHLDGLIFSQVPELTDKAFFISCFAGTPIYLTSIYYSRAKWLLSYHDNHEKLIFDNCELLTEGDIAYILNYVVLYCKQLQYIEEFLIKSVDDIYFSKDKARKIIHKIQRHLHNGFQLLHSMLQQFIDEDKIIQTL